MQIGATFSSEDEPQESVARAIFSSMVRPYLVDGTAVFVNRRYGRFRKLDGILFINGTTIRSLKVKQYYVRLKYGDGMTVVL